MRVVALLVLLVVCGPAVPAQAAEWRWPLAGDPAVSRPFAAPAHRYAAGHRGADLPAVPGAAVRAAGGGRVSYAGLVAGRGVVVVVHGDLRTTYEPVGALVQVGALVGAGEVVGVLEPGHLGCPVRACLHWGLRRGEDHLDPVRLVRPGPVRLLPLQGPVEGAAAAPSDEPARAPVRAVAPVLPPPVVTAAAGDEGRVLAPARPVAPALGPPGPALAAAAALAGAAAAATAARRRR